jgi:hypothetical protein
MHEVHTSKNLAKCRLESLRHIRRQAFRLPYELTCNGMLSMHANVQSLVKGFFG